MIVQDNPKVMLGLPCFDHHKYRMRRALESMVLYSQDAGIRIGEPESPRGAMLPIQRAECVKMALGQCDYLLFVDSDMVMQANALVRLLGRDVDIVSGLYFSRTPPFQPIAGKLIDGKWEALAEWPERELIEVDGVGAGFLLIKTEVLKDTPEPHWLWSWDEKNGYGGEDYFFCQQAKKAGFKVWLDTSLELTHIGEYPFGRHNYEEIRGVQEQGRIITPEEARCGAARIH